MAYKRLPANLPDLLRRADLEVIVVDGWHRRGRPASTGGFDPVGVLNHHIGTNAASWSRAKRLAYAKWMFATGRSDLPAPLCQIALGPDGEVYVGAGGRANHAGKAKASGSVASGDGNSLYIGIEWMLSGTQPIPAKMYNAGVTLNAVLTEEVTKTSVQTISCHYQTSATGKWDIGDPGGIPFRGKRVLDVGKFRRRVKAERKRLYSPPPKKKPKKKVRRLTIGHASMQFNDSPAQHRHDATVVFAQGYDIIGGTEAGTLRAGSLRKALRTEAKRRGYRLYNPKATNGWIAVKKSLVKSGWRRSYKRVIRSSKHEGSTRGFGPRGVVSVKFNAGKDLGKIAVATSHYLPGARRKGANSKYGRADHWALNRKLARAIGKWARKAGKGSTLAFYTGDQNMVDRYEDTFFGQPLTSCWDELEKWPGTGHGNIDVIASFDKDGRVECRSARKYNDKELHLHTDHFLIKAVYNVEVL